MTGSMSRANSLKTAQVGAPIATIAYLWICGTAQLRLELVRDRKGVSQLALRLYGRLSSEKPWRISPSLGVRIGQDELFAVLTAFRHDTPFKASPERTA